MKLLITLVFLTMPALAAGFNFSIGGRLASEPSGDIRLGYEAEPEPGIAVGFNSRFRLRGLVREGSTDPFPRNRYLSGDAQISPYLQMTQRIQMEGWRLEPYQRLEVTAGSYLFSINPSGLFVNLSASLGAKQRFNLDKTTRLSNDIQLGLDRWELIPGKPIREALVIADEIRLDFNLGFVEPYLRGSLEFFPFKAPALVFGANAGANFNFASDLEGQLEAGFKSNDTPYLQARITLRLP
jgi:hypothetical protein